jgi:hypothetical protein
MHPTKLLRAERGRLCRYIFTVLVVAMIAAFPGSSPGATTYSGSVSMWSYAVDDSVDHVYLLPAATLNLYNVGWQDLSFQTALRGFVDYRNSRPFSQQIRVLRGLFVYEPSGSHWEWRAGQQWLTEGVGRGNLAGLWTKYAFSRKTSVAVYAGARLANSLYINEMNPEQGYAAGLHAKSRLSFGTVGASYYYLARRSKLLYHAAGAEASYTALQNWLWTARFDLNVAQGSIEKLQLIGLWDARSNVEVTGEARIQTPRVYEDSFFTYFLSDATTDFVRGSARWTFYKTLYLKGGGTALFSDARTETKIMAALGIPELEVGYSKWATIENGELDGFYAKALYRFIHQAEILGGYDFSRGSNSDLLKKNESQVAYVGAGVDVGRTFSVTVRGEQIRDLLHKMDYRGLASLTARFSNLK